MSDTMMP